MNKIVPYWLDVYIALSKDYEKDNISWKTLIENIFVKNTDIYKLIYRTLIYIGIKPNEKINIKNIEKLIPNFIFSYKIIKEDGQKFICIKEENIKEELKNKEEIKFTLEYLGYREIIK